jgi:hypothetical protein
MSRLDFLSQILTALILPFIRPISPAFFCSWSFRSSPTQTKIRYWSRLRFTSVQVLPLTISLYCRVWDAFSLLFEWLTPVPSAPQLTCSQLYICLPAIARFAFPLWRHPLGLWWNVCWFPFTTPKRSLAPSHPQVTMATTHKYHLRHTTQSCSMGRSVHRRGCEEYSHYRRM